MKLKPLGDRLIVRAIEEEEKTASGLLVSPSDTAKEKPQKGKVLLRRRRREGQRGHRQADAT